MNCTCKHRKACEILGECVYEHVFIKENSKATTELQKCNGIGNVAGIFKKYADRPYSLPSKKHKHEWYDRKLDQEKQQKRADKKARKRAKEEAKKTYGFRPLAGRHPTRPILSGREEIHPYVDGQSQPEYFHID